MPTLTEGFGLSSAPQPGDAQAVNLHTANGIALLRRQFVKQRANVATGLMRVVIPVASHSAASSMSRWSPPQCPAAGKVSKFEAGDTEHPRRAAATGIVRAAGYEWRSTLPEPHLPHHPGPTASALRKNPRNSFATSDSSAAYAAGCRGIRQSSAGAVRLRGPAIGL